MRVRENRRLEWKRQQIPLLDALMDELCLSQQALLGRDLASLNDSVRRQIELAAEITAMNRQLLKPDVIDDVAMLDPSEPLTADIDGAQASELNSTTISASDLGAQQIVDEMFGAAAQAAQREARLQAAFLRRSLATVQALSNAFAMNAGTYPRPESRLVASSDPAVLSRPSTPGER